MRFHRYRWQIRWAARDASEFVVSTVGDDTGRRPSKRHVMSINPALHIIELQTDRGAVELGVQAHQVDELRSRLAPEGSSEPAQSR